jgi:predicted dienelactone hydrolase
MRRRHSYNDVECSGKQMRPIEILLSVANLLTLFILAVPQVHAVRWTGSVALIALLLAILQITVEGPRWQMIPAYLLTATFSLIWLLGIVVPGGLHVNRLIAVLGIGLSIPMLVLSIALPMLLPVFHFPKPTGSYAIGTVTYHWVDTNRPELFAPDPHDHRELMAQVWYPAKNVPAARAPYIEDADTVTPALARLTHLPGFLFTHFKYVTTNAVASAPIADDKSTYPVLIFLAGLDGFRAVNTFQIEELVSHGYIVVGLDQPGAVAMVRFPDGRQIAGLPKDAIQPLIDQSIG